MANRAWMNFGRGYENLTSPARVNMNFVVDSTNGNGLGIRSLKSNGYVKNVFMHTSSTPAGGNPNPQSGVIWIQLRDNYARSIGGSHSIVSPASGSNIPVHSSGSPLTIGVAYIITVLGTTSTAEWHTLGVPAGVTPAVGVSFIALTVGTGAGTGQAQLPSKSGISVIETIGDPNLSLGPQGVSNQGAWIMLQCLAATDASTTTLIPTAPANGSVIALSMLLDMSSVNVDGL